MLESGLRWSMATLLTPPFIDQIRHILLCVPGRATSLTTISQQFLPSTVFEALPQCFFGQFIDTPALRFRFRTEFRQEFVRHAQVHRRHTFSVPYPGAGSLLV